MAIIDADEKPVSCEFIGCNGNVRPYLIGTTTNIEILEQESILDKIRAEIVEYKDDKIIHAERNEMIDIVLAIINKYKTESEK